LQSGRGPEMVGYSKIRGCCAQAALDGFDYAWIDSCCIDKTSSSELSEAINSMFNFYRKAQVCYAYLSDVPEGEGGEDHLREGSHFRASAWFTRGWTLQELLAPRYVVFFDRAWVDIGTKSSLQSLVSAITGIGILDYRFERACVAQKMSWASRRQTTRTEDQAYCLMGLFGVSMPPLYGEGSKAFYRLQLEILKDSDDESLFAWTGLEDYGNGGSMLAPSPAAFSDCGNVVRYVFDMQKPEFTMTNRGLRMETELLREADTDAGIMLAPLNCSLGDDKPLGVRLRRVFKDRFLRMPSRSHVTLGEMNESRGNRTSLYVLNRQPNPIGIKYNPKTYNFKFTTSNLLKHGFGFPGTLFISSPHHPQVRVDGLANIEFSLGEHKHWGQDDKARTPVFNHFVTFLSKEKAWKKGFTVFLRVEPEGFSISILVPASATRVNRWHAISRVSAPLHSGTSVNVAVKEQGEGLERKCVVDVNIDPEGKLRWHSSRSEGLGLAEFGFFRTFP
jgi:hypothetical protein